MQQARTGRERRWWNNAGLVVLGAGVLLAFASGLTLEFRHYHSMFEDPLFWAGEVAVVIGVLAFSTRLVPGRRIVGSSEIFIARPPDRVYSLLTDVSRSAQLTPRLKLVSVDGQTVTYRGRYFGLLPFTAQFTTRVEERPRRIVSDGRMGRFNVWQEQALEDVPGGTLLRVTYAQTVLPIATPLSPLVSDRSLRRPLRRALERIKRVAETPPAKDG